MPVNHHTPMKTKNLLALSLLILTGTTTLRADTFGSGPDTFTIDFVNIGNAGNGNNGSNVSVSAGGVAYGFNMGVTEVAQDWITKATNLGLSNVTAGAWAGNQPAADLTWYEAAAFVNFLNVSTGHQAAYQLDSGNTALTLWSSAQAWQAGGENLYRHKDAYYFLPSENEWYKAAYHKNDGVTANYWYYPTVSNTAPTPVAGGTVAGTAVYNGGAVVAPADVTNAGGLSAYGTLGQGGNVVEWRESAFDGVNDAPSEYRVFGGGSWASAAIQLSTGLLSGNDPAFSDSTTGFRVASVPEPSCAGLLLSASLLSLAQRRRRAAL